MFSKKTSLLICLAVLSIFLTSCGSGKKAIQIKGSDTMVNLGQVWAEVFMQEHPEIPVAVTGGGSGTGIAALINKTADIALSSRNMTAKEIEGARLNKVEPKEIKVAYDGIAIVVSPKNPLTRLTIPQLSDIFSGKIKNWQGVGGPNKKIVCLSRDRNSGTHVFFMEHVVKLGKKSNPNEFAKDVLMMPSSQAIVEEVAGNASAIGYIGLGYMDKRLKALAVSSAPGLPYVMPSPKTVSNKSYPISRAMFLYTNGEPTGKVKTFIDFVLGPKGQALVAKMDFVPAYTAPFDTIR